jgi:nondiscriminating glutamyl-tRNA synthetase
MNHTVRTRFAPSPTGLLHLGNARTALFAWLAARHAGPDGRAVLRIEDTDLARHQEAAIAALTADLAWLGLDFDEGPGRAGPYAPYRQSERLDRHAAAATALLDAGHAYPCFCTDEELEAHRALARASGRPPRYAGTCRELDASARAARVAAGRVASLRFAVPSRRVVTFADAVHGEQRVATSELGDFVIQRRDGTPTFLFANAVDDADMAITLALRGEDHLANTPRQLLVLEALGRPAPRYGHLPLVHGAQGPLSKRDGAASVGDLRTAGYLPLAVVNYLARLGHSGYPDGLLSHAELAAGFALGHLGRAPARFDLTQLAHFQKLAVQALDSDTFLAWLAASGVDITVIPIAARAGFVAAVRGNVSLPSEAGRWTTRLYAAELAFSAEALSLLGTTPRALFEAALAAGAEPELDAVTAAVQAATGARGPALFRPLRAALTGELAGPDLKAWWRLLPADRRLARLRQALTHAL